MRKNRISVTVLSEEDEINNEINKINENKINENNSNENVNENVNENFNENCNENINENIQLTPDQNDQIINQLNDFQSNEQLNKMEEISSFQSYNQQSFLNSFNQGINIIDSNVYSPMVYLFDENKIIYSDNNNNYVYNLDTKEKKNILPYTYVNRNSIIKPHFDIKQNKLKLYNYWIITSNIKKVQNDLIKMFGIENIYITKSLFFRKKNSYMGEKVILINKIPQKPYKFINRLNKNISIDKRTVKSVLGDYIISPDCIIIILSEKSIDYICNNYFRYHKEDSIKIKALNKSIKNKFTCLEDNEMEE